MDMPYNIYNLLYETDHPKPLFDPQYLFGKAKKAYDTIHEETKPDRRRLKWAHRYLRVHGYELVSPEERDKLMAEYEKEREEDRAMKQAAMKVLENKFPALAAMAGYFGIRF